MKALIVLVFVVVLAVAALGRPVRIWSPGELLEQSDVVVIAKPLASKDTEETSGGTGGWPAMVGVDTKFEISAVLKGDKASKELTLRHFRLSKDSDETLFIDGPALLKLANAEGRQFLLFLRRDAGGRLTPLSGQIDPGLSVYKLEEAHH